jgi:indolepyruvate decarboxylase
MPNQTFTVADYLLTRLKQLNVTEVFQIPGDYVKHFTQTLENFPGVKAIGCANELDAGYAADAYGRTRGLAAISLQYGVSTYSALNAIAGAYVERSPIVVISATPGSDARNITNMFDVLYHHSTGNLQADEEIFKHVTVGAITLSTSVGAAEQIDNLIVQALTHQKPVYIACYKEVWGETCPQPSATPLQALVTKSQPLALQNALAQAWGQITAAKKPLIFAGVEVLRHGLAPLLQEIIDVSGFLYTTTTLGKTVLDEGGDKFIGTYADAASIDSVVKTVAEADCFLTLGTIMTDDYLFFIENQYPNMVLANTAQVRVGYYLYEGVTMADFMKGLLHLFKTSKPGKTVPSYPLTAIAPPQPAYPQPWLANSDKQWAHAKDVITYNRFFQHMMKFLTDHQLLNQIVMTYGVSCSLYVATNAYGLKQNSFISSAAWQCIGYETGAAMGAQMGSGKQAWTVAGDGAFMMICQSLSTLARNQLNAVIFVMSNQVYAIEQVYVDIKSFNPGSENKFDTFDILPKWDYMALAKAFNADGHRVETIDELNDLFKILARTVDKPTLVEVVIPQKDLPGQMYRLGTMP